MRPEIMHLTLRTAPSFARWACGLPIALPVKSMTNFDRYRNGNDFALPTVLSPSEKQEVEAVARFLAGLCCFTEAPPISGRLPFSYHVIPERVRDIIAKIIGAYQKQRESAWAHFPGWPLDLSVDAWRDAACEQPRPERRTPVILTHDLDSPEGLDSFLEYFSSLEIAHGARSVCYIVPCKWSLNFTQLDTLTKFGHELGIHGFDHANRTPFLDRGQMDERIEAARHTLSAYPVKGYRAPSLLRTPALYSALVKHFAYDSSIPTSGGLYPCPNNGCASARPLRIRQLPVIPLSLPRDGSLRFLGYSPAFILKLWQTYSLRIAESGGIVVLLTHCEKRFSGNAAMLNVYQKFLAWVESNERLYFALPMQVLENDIFSSLDLEM